jgi:hypothetical protein
MTMDPIPLNPSGEKFRQTMNTIILGAHKRGRDDMLRCLKDAFSIAETRSAVFTQAQVLEIIEVAGKDFDAHADKFLAVPPS